MRSRAGRGMPAVLVGIVLALVVAAAGCGRAAEAPFRIGVLADCTGILFETHDWALAAAELPLLQHGGQLAGKGPSGGVRGATVAGRPVEIVQGCSESGVYGRLINETRQLVEIDKVDAVVGALGASDGIVFRELARRYPTVPFLLAGSSPREATVHAPAANLYRFSGDVEQEQAGLATYAYETLGWRTAATVSEQSQNGWGATAAFEAEFCALGGRVERIWGPAFGAGGPLVPKVPASVDGVVVFANYGFWNPVPFLRAYLASHRDAQRSLLLNLWLYMPLDLPTYASFWPRVRGVVARLSGLPSASSAGDASYRRAFARAFPGLPASVAGNLTVSPYHDAVEALVRALMQTRGDIGADRGRLRAALDSMQIETSEGLVRLDRNRQAVVPATLVQLDGTKPGAPSLHVVRRIPAVDETLGGLLPASASPGPAGSCQRGTPPPWAR